MNLMSPQKVLFLSPSMQGKGGVVDFCQMLIENLDPSFEVDHFIVANRPGNRNVLKRLNYLLGDFLKLRKRLKSHRYSLVHLNPSFKILAMIRDGLYMMLINRFYPQRILVIFHGWDSRLAAKMTKNPFYRTLVNKTYKKAAMILVLASEFKHQLEKMDFCPERIKVITTMYQGNFEKKKNDGTGTNSRIYLLFISRFVEAKGIYIAAQVVKLLVDHGYKDFYFFFAGDGPEYDGLKNYVEKNRLEDYVRMTGFITGEEKRNILEGSDILLFPTHYGEGCPVVLLEAMGAGLAVISTPIAAIPEIVENNKNGFIIDSMDPKDFFEAARNLLEDKELLKKFQDQNREKAKKNYEASVVTRKIETLYTAVIENEKV
ncbi:MAG: glycosyltransferase family 4 protein [Candidatus Aminicenantes bacterium]|nr:MAG: glycosyltransferase family 4 protein [Candidatus Aminicenantes bacterium]